MVNNDMVTVSNNENVADQFFGIQTNYDGTISFTGQNKQTEDDEEDMATDIQTEIDNAKNILTEMKNTNPSTKLNDTELKDLYDEFYNDGFVIF